MKKPARNLHKPLTQMGERWEWIVQARKQKLAPVNDQFVGSQAVNTQKNWSLNVVITYFDAKFIRVSIWRFNGRATLTLHTWYTPRRLGQASSCYAWIKKNIIIIIIIMAILSHHLPISFSNQNVRWALIHSLNPPKDHLSLHYFVGPLRLSGSDLPSVQACYWPHYYWVDFCLSSESFFIFSASC